MSYRTPGVLTPSAHEPLFTQAQNYELEKTRIETRSMTRNIALVAIPVAILLACFGRAEKMRGELDLLEGKLKTCAEAKK